MNEYFLTTKTDKIELVDNIIINEDLYATRRIEKDVNGIEWIIIYSNEEDYLVLKDIFRMIEGL